MTQHQMPPLFHPLRLIATCFGLGRLQSFSADISGSLIAMALFFIPGFLDSRGVNPELLLVTGLAIVLGFFSSIWYVHQAGLKNTTDIAIDALAGQLLAITLFFLLRDFVPALGIGKSKFHALFIGGGFYTLMALFLLFRFFQSWNIGLARVTLLAGETRGGSAIMVQAVSAAVFAAVTLHAIVFCVEYLKQPGVW